MGLTRQASQTVDARANAAFTRDYTIHLRLTVPGSHIALDEADEAVADVVDTSLARAVLQTALDARYAIDADWVSPTIENFYLVSATRPEGAIE